MDSRKSAGTERSLLRNTGPLPEELAHIDDEGKLLEVDARSLQYTDASFQSTFDYKSVSGYCIFYAGAVVDWGSLTQKVIATSTMESELIATQKAVSQMVHVRNLLEDLNTYRQDMFRKILNCPICSSGEHTSSILFAGLHERAILPGRPGDVKD